MTDGEADRVDHAATQTLVLDLTQRYTPAWVRRIVVYRAPDGSLWATDGEGVNATADTYPDLVQHVNEAAWLIYGTTVETRAEEWLDDHPDGEPAALIRELLNALAAPPAPDRLADQLDRIADDVEHHRLAYTTPQNAGVPFAGNPAMGTFMPINEAAARLRRYAVDTHTDPADRPKAVTARLRRALAAISTGQHQLALDHLEYAATQLRSHLTPAAKRRLYPTNPPWEK